MIVYTSDPWPAVGTEAYNCLRLLQESFDNEASQENRHVDNYEFPFMLR